MEEAVKITTLAMENVKRVKAVSLTPSPSGLTVLAGKNAQGKTSVLDGICYALGGEKYRPSSLKREGAMNDPYLHVELSNGIVVERKGANSSLRVFGNDTGLGGQRLLNSFIGELALNLPKFIEATAAEKAQQLLGALGCDKELAALQADEKRLYDERHDLGTIATAKRKACEELPQFEDAPEERIDIAEMSRAMAEKVARNQERARKRLALEETKNKCRRMYDEIMAMQEKLKGLREEYDRVRAESMEEIEADEPIGDIEEQMRLADEANARYAANETRANAEEEAKEAMRAYDEKEHDLLDVREKIMALLEGVKFPLKDLGINMDGAKPELTYKGQKWDGMSGMEQLRVATAVCHAINPKTGFVLLDKLE